MKIGDSAKVKDGIKEPDTEDFELSDWQGRIVEIYKKADHEGNILITIEWDSLTLLQIPAKFIQQSEIDGLDWKTMVLYESDLNKTDSRDSEGDVKKTQEILSEKYYWFSIGEEGSRISNVLEGVNPKDEMKCFQAWDKYLDKELSFPIQAIVSESADNWLIKCGDKVQIKSLSEIVDMYGIIAAIILKGKSYKYPLCDLEVLDKKANNHQLIQDYCVWFSNR
jgi:hypothetical protein